MIKFLPQILMVASIMIYLSFYLVGIYKGRVKPVLATWLIFLFAALLSIFTDYRESGFNGLLANAFNIVDTLAIVIVFSVILFNKNTRLEFTIFEKRCLGVVFLIFILWILTGQNVLAHLAIQVIMVIAYLPMIIHLWNATKNTESLGMWSFDSIASILGMVEPLKTGAILPLVYSLRSTISTFLVIILIFRLKYRSFLFKESNV